MEIVLLILAGMILVLLAVVLVKLCLPTNKEEGKDDALERLATLMMSRQELANGAQKQELVHIRESMMQKLDATERMLAEKQDAARKEFSERIGAIEPRLKTLEETNEQKLENIRKTVSERLSYIQEDNNKKLGEIQKVVDEKLQKTLEEKMNESFKLVSERLEQVHKGLGEMQTIAVGVGDLKKVLSNVKNRGILGEIQLGAILGDILAPEQYDMDVATIPGSTNRVEFAVKLPGAAEGETVYLPIDSKFPGDTYAALQDAYELGDKTAVDAAKKLLVQEIKKCAKDIRDKYVQPPHTTAFGILFLPFEGLYAEVVNMGLVEILQKDFGINITGPSTMAAMLNSLQMGFRTLAIQKRSNEVWKILGLVKSEFETFESVLNDTQKRLHMVDQDLEKLIGVRTRQINRRLRDVEVLDAPSEE